MKNLIGVIVVILAAPAGADAPINTLIPQIKSLDHSVSGTKMTLTADVGRWANAPRSYTYNWRTVDGANLGKGRTLTFDNANPGVIGSAIVLEVTAKNAQGATTQASHWFGPIETAPPAAPVENETLPAPREELPTEPAHFLQNGHAIFPGCDIPPPDPTAISDHVWVFDPVNGRTENEGATGHADKPFRDLTAFFNGGAGYAGVLWKRLIQPGDTIYLEPGWGGSNPVGDIIGPLTNVGYSTSDGTASGAIRWTWIMGDPAAASRPVLHRVAVGNGNGSVAGFLFKGFNVEQYRGTNLVSVGFNNNVVGQPTHDVHFEDISVSGWLGHSNDPWEPSHYPTFGGTSDGTVLTASPLISPSAPQDPATPTATAAKGSTHITLSSAATVGSYIWSPGYYRSGTLAAGVGGIPNGTKIIAMNGLEATIAPCDPVADAATGCPTEPIPGCDPIVSGSGGCPNGPVPWSGTTRALNGEKISLTDSMKVLPAGYFNSTDWEMAYASGFRFAGQLDRAGSVDQANPNLLRGVKCTSIKDSVVRDLYNGIQMANVTNSVIYNNKVKWVSGDLMDAYTTHRIWFIDNHASEPTLIWAHQDGIQFGDTNGNVAIKYYYNNAVIENEFIQHSDDTNPFLRPMQGVNTTENYHWGMYVCCNVINVDNNALRIAGKWDVVAHNTVFGNATVVEHQRKTQGGVPQDLTATHHLLANNVGNGVGRDSAIPDYCRNDLNKVEGNFSLPFLPLIGASQVYCDKAGAGYWDAAMGVYQGLTTWSLTDWRSMFVAYRPNPDFAGLTGTIAATVRYYYSLPAGQPVGTLGVVTTLYHTGAGDHPAGVWEYCPTTPCGAVFLDAAGWNFIQPDFNPGIIGAGVNLGAQQPIVDHDGKAWANPPSVGAYEESNGG